MERLSSQPHSRKGTPARLRCPPQRLYPLELGARSHGDSTADIRDVRPGTEHAEERSRRGAACIAGIADIPDVLDGAGTQRSGPDKKQHLMA